MVRVPGSSEDAGYHRTSQEDEDVQAKIEGKKTEESLEDRLPVNTQENKKVSKDRPDLGRGLVNMVKVELIKEKPKHPPYFLVKDALGHNIYHALKNNQSKVKTDTLLSLKSKNYKIYTKVRSLCISPKIYVLCCDLDAFRSMVTTRRTLKTFGYDDESVVAALALRLARFLEDVNDWSA
ncbi:unnamed protein product [Peronospora belbahrii]|uniref:Reverse transcriptase Ty1/copia-type domain-containing protein n=1 Tax=Peronospora belbahrii TaxID=622444 RepID=A0ABN8CUB3_9STRA|nr:unnamed protein product [Peronospora belbahrii]